MATAKRHYLPGYIWHITHRCHKREFLLGYAKDRHWYLQWLYEARKYVGAGSYEELKRSHKGWV